MDSLAHDQPHYQAQKCPELMLSDDQKANTKLYFTKPLNNITFHRVLFLYTKLPCIYITGMPTSTCGETLSLRTKAFPQAFEVFCMLLPAPRPATLADVHDLRRHPDARRPASLPSL